MKKALTGVRVLDLSGALSGPYCGLLLADLGAEVIKVEPPSGDIFRNIGPYYQGEWSGYFVAVNRNKRGIVVDLKNEAGLQVFYDLVRVCDVVLDNFRPGVVERLRIDHDTLSKINPKIISCSITGYGSTGVYKHKAAFDLCVQASGGLMSVTGQEDGTLAKVGTPIGDLAAGQFAAIGILAALAERSSSGLGQHVDISMFDCQISLLAYWVPWFYLSGEVPKPLGTGHLGISPHGAYSTKDGQIAMVIGSEKFWRQLCEILGISHLADDPRFDTAKKRRDNRHELKEIIEEILRTRTTAEWMVEIERIGIPAAPVNTLDKAFAEPVIAERNMIVSVEQPRAGKVHMAGNPIKMSRTPGEEFAPTASLGEHTAEVLKDLLDYSEEKIDQLLHQGAIKQHSVSG
ncbi:MAG: CaiB/BaiF CoA transferase family protein [Chloroflexota bacterium]|jgi:CoA:oxalate CoA-transferase